MSCSFLSSFWNSAQRFSRRLWLAAFCQSTYFSSTSGIERADFLDQVAQVLQVAFAVGDFLVHHHAVKAFLGRLGEEFLGDGDVLLGGEAEAVNQALHLRFGLLDALADLDFLLAGEQRHLAHLVHVHPHRVVQDFQAAVLFLFRFRRLGALHLGLVHDLDVEVAQLGVKLVQVLRRQPVRQDVVDVVVGDVAVLLGQVEQGLDGFGQIQLPGPVWRLLECLGCWRGRPWPGKQSEPWARSLGGSGAVQLALARELYVKSQNGGDVRCALVDAGVPRGRPRRSAPSADLFSFLFSINNQTRVSPISSDIFAGRPRTRFITGTSILTAR